MIISGQVPQNQTDQYKLQQEQQALKLGQQLGKAGSTVKNKLSMATMPNNPMMGAGGSPATCPTCGAPMQSDDNAS